MKKTKLKITLLIDNPTSWIAPYAKKIKKMLQQRGHQVTYCNSANKIPLGDCAFFLSCEKIVPKSILSRNEHNLVIHESSLPKGKGWSPLTWQILAGKNVVPITLFEAVDKVDSGPIYSKKLMRFRGDELLDELHKVQGEKTVELVLEFVKKYPKVTPKNQFGQESFYRKRNSKDSELNINKTISEQFNLLRVVDNKKYPAFLKYLGKTYLIKISKVK